METDWQDIARIIFPPEILNGVAQTPIVPSFCIFDNLQDLLWTGNEYGRVTSFYGTELQRYTSYRANAKEEGPVRQVCITDKGVVSVGRGSVHLAMRRGLAIWHLTHQDFQDLRCLCPIPGQYGEILVAGAQSKMFRINEEKGEIIETIKSPAHYSLLKKGSQFICAATVDGWVQLLDPKTLQIKKSWHAHQAFVTDMDVNANFLVTCGCSSRPSLGSIPDPLVKVFDLKTLMPLPPVTFHGGAAFVRLHPRMQTTCIIASQSGQMQVSDIMSGTLVSIRQLNMTSYLMSLDMAPSGEAIILTDSLGYIELWGSPQRVRFLDLATPTEFADPVAPTISMDWNGNQPLSTIGMPYYKEVLLSAWPSHLIFDVGAPPPRADPNLLATLTRTDMGYYGPNPRKLRRNQAINTRESEASSRSLDGPKFLSEQAKEASNSEADTGRRISDALETLNSLSVQGNIKDDVPATYRPVEIKYSKFGVEDFDFKYYNKTQFSGLETHITNCYLNPLLQLLRFTPCIRNLALAHTASACMVDTCMLCELGFLFDMLEKANGQNCQAYNFLKTFSTIPEANQLGLLEDAIGPRDLSMAVQSACRFVLGKIKDDFKRLPQHVATVESAVVTRSISMIRCGHCNSEFARPANSIIHELTYPPRTPNKHLRLHGPTFSQILKASVERHDPTRGWCDRCKRYQSMHGRKTVQATAPVLMFNTAIRTLDAKQMWARRGWLPKEIGIIVDNGQFFCYEGQDLRMHLARKMFKIHVYELVGMVLDIHSDASQKPHLVSMINVSPSLPKGSPENQWHLFNDFLVRSIPEDDALRFDVQWKLPAIVTYQAKEHSHVVDDSWKDSLDTSILYRRWSVGTSEDPKVFRPLNAAVERPTSGMSVGIDAEFVKLAAEEIEVRADGTRHILRPSELALARVSVVRGKRRMLPDQKEQDDYIPFIDDYINVQDPIIDYLTEFSGIAAGDLNPATSPYATTGRLISRKIAYKKIWLLVNLGCLFVGHGLPKDFRTINIHIPASQVVDTVNLFYDAKQSYRKLSLKFLTWYLLSEVIQSEDDAQQALEGEALRKKGHDSVIDAKMALRLWEQWLQYESEGRTQELIDEIYRKGRNMNFQVPKAARGTPASILANRMSAPVESLGGSVDGGSIPGTPSSKAATIRAP